MQNKGLIRLLAIALALVCFYQLYFTYKTNKVERDAKAYGITQAKLKNVGATPLQLEALAQKSESSYLDSIASQPVYNFFGLRKYTYREVSEYSIPLGLDLKGGMNVTLEISVVDLVRAMSGYSTDSTFTAAIKLALQNQKNSQEDFVSLCLVKPSRRLIRMQNLPPFSIRSICGIKSTLIRQTPMFLK